MADAEKTCSETVASPPVWRFRFVIAYDGGGYAGWQVQKTGIGVQEKVEAALKHLFPGAGRVHGSSRTDTGVHALGMVAHTDIPRPQFRMPVMKLALALNALLPPDIRVLEARRCSRSFHARFDASGKQYRYLIWNHRAMNPLLRFQAWHVPQPLDLPSMRAAAAVLVGRHDFRSFAATRNYEMETTVRTVTRCELRRQGSQFWFLIEGDGFLYKMCRGIVGTLVQVGKQKFTPADVRRMLQARDRSAGGMTAPAHGLTLWKVFYQGKSRGARTTQRRAENPS